MKLLLIGAGTWGQNYIKTLAPHPDVELIVATKSNWKDLINTIPDGVMIATQPERHIEIGHYSLSKGIPTMIEKPLALSLKEAEQLSCFNVPILVNHIHLFSTAYQKIKSFNSKITSIYSQNFNNGPVRTYSSLYDYGCHDVAMTLDLADETPHTVGIERSGIGPKYLYTIKMKFKDFDSISVVGNGGESKIREFIVNGTDRYHDGIGGIDHYPLTNAINVFISAINGKHDYRLGLSLSFEIIKILDSFKNNIY